MGNKKTSHKLKKSSKSTFSEWQLDEKPFLDRALIGKILAEALIDGDFDTFRDVLSTHMKVVSKAKLVKSSGVSRKQIYNLINDKEFDPRLSTVSAILRSLKAS